MKTLQPSPDGGPDAPAAVRGRHLILELWGCNGRIGSTEAVRAAVIEAVEAIGATLLNLYVHGFRPHGVTAVAALAESHLSIHTWPEHGYLAADVFTCSQTARPEALRGVLQGAFEPDSVAVAEFARGDRAAASVPGPRPLDEV